MPRFKELAFELARQVPSLYGYKLGYKVLWLKPDKHYITRKVSRLTSAQSYITGLYSVRYSPLHIINSCHNTLLFMQIAILLHDLQLHLIIINIYTGTILKLYRTLIKDVHLNREENSVLQMITCTNSMHNLQGFHQNI